MSNRRTAIWIDDREAHLFRVGAEPFAKSIILAPQRAPRHQERAAPAHNHPDDEQRFFREVSDSLNAADRVLILGPSTAKLHFRDYLLDHASTLKINVVGVETVDHPTDNQLAVYAHQYFASEILCGRPAVQMSPR